MATRFYFAGIGGVPFPGNIDRNNAPVLDTSGLWTATRVIFASDRLTASPNPGFGTGVSKDSDNADNADPGYWVATQFTSEPIPATSFTTGMTVKGQFQCLDVSAANTMGIACSIRVFTNDGTAQRGAGVLRRWKPTTIASPPSATQTSDFDDVTLENRTLPVLNLANNITALNGDRIVFEVGMAVTGAPAVGTADFRIRFDDAQPADLPEDETEQGTAFNCWIEFSNDIYVANRTCTTRGTT